MSLYCYHWLDFWNREDSHYLLRTRIHPLWLYLFHFWTVSYCYWLSIWLFPKPKIHKSLTLLQKSLSWTQSCKRTPLRKCHRPGNRVAVNWSHHWCLKDSSPLLASQKTGRLSKMESARSRGPLLKTQWVILSYDVDFGLNLYFCSLPQHFPYQFIHSSLRNSSLLFLLQSPPFDSSHQNTSRILSLASYFYPPGTYLKESWFPILFS